MTLVKVLKCYKDHKKLGLRPIFLDLIFLPKGRVKNGITSSAIKREGVIFMKNVFSKKFLKCCKDHKKLQHYRATTNISRPHFLTKRPSEKTKLRLLR